MSLKVSAYCRFCTTKWLNVDALVRLIEVSAECRLINFHSKCGKKILGLELVST